MYCRYTHFTFVQVFRVPFDSLDWNWSFHTCKLLPIRSLWENWLFRNFSNFDWSDRVMKLCLVLSESMGISNDWVRNRHGWEHIWELYLCICWNKRSNHDGKCKVVSCVTWNRSVGYFKSNFCVFCFDRCELVQKS